jgi:hypothetical protein
MSAPTGFMGRRALEETTIQRATDLCLITYRSLLPHNSRLIEETLKVKKRESLPGLEDDYATEVTR